jgi:hypothetical protein
VELDLVGCSNQTSIQCKIQKKSEFPVVAEGICNQLFGDFGFGLFIHPELKLIKIKKLKLN